MCEASFPGDSRSWPSSLLDLNWPVAAEVAVRGPRQHGFFTRRDAPTEPLPGLALRRAQGQIAKLRDSPARSSTYAQASEPTQNNGRKRWT